ncbi:peptidylprolyl isomerase [Luteibaculum oceani]|uniref:Periplasmic chaperone PpiD n=1 Tax=Luteibaculum oceani TaxID=1294296 RepID=A0A5C6UY98_9FLAO|nr:peptidylprolyl isomerase [Luteibaculum oceani]TXC75615.1 hypothetical protein FRX97_11590 [Luteibaculum oceani]
MATIGKIRKRSGLLLIVIGGAMAAFILGDFFSGGGGRQEIIVGEIDGNEIDTREFEYRVEEIAEAQKSVGATVNENTKQQLREQVWNQFIRENTISKEIEALGLSVPREEYDDVRFGSNILEFIRTNQQFQNPETGQFEPNNVRQFFAVIQEQYPMYWKLQKENVIETRLNQKYFNLIEKGIYVNQVQGKHNYVALNKQFAFDYVMKNYNAVSDSLISFTEDELEDYYNEHKSEARFKQAESRSIDFIVFQKTATQEDRDAIRRELVDLKNEFAQTDNDTDFVMLNGDVQFYRPLVYTEGSTDATTDSLILNASVGSVVGPYEQAGAMKISKVVVNGKVPEVNARHILLKPTGTETIEDIEAKADSLIRVIKKNKNFEALAAQISEDRGSAANGGNLDWFGKGQMVAPFEKAAFDAKKGELTKATSQFGVHVIEVLDRREVEQVQLATISRAIQASTETIEEVYNTASEFSISNDNEEAFYAAAEEKGYQVREANDVAPGSTFLPGLGANAQKVARWMIGAELGQVSEPLELDNQFVVAILTDISEEGEPSLEKVRAQMQRELLREKKAEKLMAEMKGSDLQEIATAVESTVKQATSTFSSVTIAGAGREPKVVGQIATLPEGSVSVPLKGELGVYVVKVTSVTEPAETTSYASNIISERRKLVQRTQNSAYQALVDKADIKDERYKYFY